WDGSSNPFASGYLTLVQNGSDVWLRVDKDGSGSANSYTTLVVFKNTTTDAITSANLVPAYPTDGSGIAGQTINGDPGGVTTDDTLNGTIGDDTINGLNGNDTLSGGNGNDHLNG